ncbi:MAG TPA: hypothetical protein VGB73_15160 [Pyrinomonadaceae bacterium]|jgi:hypothetical protein
MPAKKDEKNGQRRTQVKELPRPEKELSREEQQKVKGGIASIQDQTVRQQPPKI